MKLLARLLGLKNQAQDLENQKGNIDLGGGNSTNVKFQISINKILQHSAKTHPDNE